ncbi:MAG: CBS domain-containing protein [Planctomycetota bacterium]
MKAYELLQTKGTAVHSTSPDANLQQVVQLLVNHNCGSLLVMNGEKVLGIITERDILRTCDGESRSLSDIKVRERMSSRLVTAAPQNSLTDLMGMFTSNRIRHLPIMEEGRLAGIVSIGDVVKAQYKSLSLENEYLKSYIQS